MTEEPNDSELLQAGTVDSVRCFLEVKIRKHELGENVGNPILTATKRIMDVGEDVPGMAARDLDLEALFTRFRNKNGAELTDGSAQAYQSRFRRAHTMYLKWLDGEPWNVGGRQRAWTTSRNGTPSRRSSGTIRSEPTNGSGADEHPTPSAVTTPTPAPTSVPATVLDSNLFDYRVECDNGKVAVLQLPRRYNKTDATRMKAIIDALARDEPSAASESNA